MPPVSLDFLPWFAETFPSVLTSADPVLIGRLVHSTIFYSARDEEQPLDYYFLCDMMSGGMKKADGKRDRSAEWVKAEVERALQHPYTRHSWEKHLASNIKIDQGHACRLLADWNRFVLPAKHPNAYHPASLIDPSSAPEKTADNKFKGTIQKNKEILRKHFIKQNDNDEQLGPILCYLNQQKPPPAILARRIEERLHAVELVRDEAMKLAHDDESRESLRRSYALRLHALHAAAENAIGGYLWRRASDDNYRIFTQGYSLASVMRDDRQAITPQSDGFVEFDLASAHLAIASKLFGGLEMASLLQRKKVWRELLACTGYAQTNDNKTVLKQTVYAMLYGSSTLRQQTLMIQDPDGHKFIKEKLDKAQHAAAFGPDRPQGRTDLSLSKAIIKSLLRNERNTKRAHGRLKNHPAIRELLQNRDIYSRRILAAGGAIDAFGVFHRLTKERNSSRIISAVTSSYEKALLTPIYEAAFRSTDFFVVFDQHDGLTIFLRRQKEQVRTAKLLRRLEDAVAIRAAQLGILTHLEIKNT